MFHYHPIESSQFVPLETDRGREFGGVQPEFGKAAAILDMNVRWFRVLVAVEEEAKGANAEDYGHRGYSSSSANSMRSSAVITLQSG